MPGGHFALRLSVGSSRFTPPPSPLPLREGQSFTMLCPPPTPDNVPQRNGGTATATGGDMQMTTAIRSMLARCCLLLGAHGHRAITISRKPRRRGATNRGSVESGAGPRHPARRRSAGPAARDARSENRRIQRHLRRSHQGIRPAGAGRQGRVRRHHLGQHHRRNAGRQMGRRPGAQPHGQARALDQLLDGAVAVPDLLRLQQG